MKKELSPVAMIGIIVVAVLAIAVFGYKMLQPAKYTPSPGAYGTGGSTPGNVQASGKPASGSTPYYPTAPAGSTPGKPPGLSR